MKKIDFTMFPPDHISMIRTLSTRLQAKIQEANVVNVPRSAPETNDIERLLGSSFIGRNSHNSLTQMQISNTSPVLCKGAEKTVHRKNGSFSTEELEKAKDLAFSTLHVPEVHIIKTSQGSVVTYGSDIAIIPKTKK